jgi:hypothetical protein
MSDQPIAWMLRAARALHTRSARQYGEYRVLCGQVFMSEKTATAAAERETNSWRKVEAFPVYTHVPRDLFDAGFAACWAWMMCSSDFKPPIDTLSDDVFDHSWEIYLATREPEGKVDV